MKDDDKNSQYCILDFHGVDERSWEPNLVETESLKIPRKPIWEDPRQLKKLRGMSASEVNAKVPWITSLVIESQDVDFNMEVKTSSTETDEDKNN
ncbi:MAG: hypothetical protein ACI4NE_08050 [Succinivibrio sp.]